MSLAFVPLGVGDAFSRRHHSACVAVEADVPTTALRIRAGGRALGLSADTLFDRALVEWLAAADVVLHETGFGPHTALADLAALPVDLRARLRLIHFPDELDVATAAIPPLEERRRHEVFPPAPTPG